MSNDSKSMKALATRLKEEIARRAKAEKRLSHALSALKEARQSLAEFKGLEAADAAGGLAHDELLITINHQMRSPLNVLLNSLKLLGGSVLSPDQMELVNAGNQAANSLLYQVNQLRDLGQIELQGLELDEADVSVADLVDDVIDLFSAQARTEHVVLFGRVSPDAAVRIRCDIGRVRQILINLVAYAFTFRSGDDILLSVRCADDKLAFSIYAAPAATTRSGFRTGAYRLESARQAPEDTTGLGLVITHKLVELLGGEMSSRMLGDDGLHLVAFLPLKLARQEKDRYIESLKSALAETNLVLIGHEPTEASLLVQALDRWNIKHPRQPKARNLESAKKKPDLALAEGDDTTLLRASARMGIRSIGLLPQHGAEPGQDDSLPELTLIRLPMTERELLETLAQPELRRTGGVTVKDFPDPAQSAHVLVAEDSLANRMITLRVLEKLGHRAYGVADGKEALMAARQIEFDMILMDLKMPVMDGIGATRRILEEQKESAPPIVALTGDSQKGRRQECLDAGMSDFLLKPVDAAELAQAVATWGKEGRGRRIKRNARTHESLPLLDRSGLVRMQKEVDASLIPEIGSMFLIELEAKIKDAQRLAAKNRYKLIPKVIHPLKSSTRSFGAKRLAEIISQLEKTAGSEDEEVSDQYLALLEEVAKETSELLRAQFRKLEESAD
ncbi:MAG: response regulator [Xanthomonadales bacterium]|nr:response regulator [Xanthomonadales bacterium]